MLTLIRPVSCVRALMDLLLKHKQDSVPFTCSMSKMFSSSILLFLYFVLCVSLLLLFYSIGHWTLDLRYEMQQLSLSYITVPTVYFKKTKQKNKKNFSTKTIPSNSQCTPICYIETRPLKMRNGIIWVLLEWSQELLWHTCMMRMRNRASGFSKGTAACNLC